MLLNKTARSSTLRLALLYVGLFSASIFGLLAYSHRSTISYLERDLDRATVAERAVLMQAYESGGRNGLIALIDQRLNDERLPGWYYELSDASFTPIAGNLRQWPAWAQADMEWSTFKTFDATEADPHPLRATYRSLSNGDHLLLGRQVDALNAFAAKTVTALAATAALFLILAIAAGVSTARRSVTRIEAINTTSREIMRSGLGKRIPLRGTGDEWDELATNLNSMLARIEELVETNRQVSDNVAHDLRTPLTRMRARLEKATAQTLDPCSYRSILGDTIADLDGVLGTFSSLLRISRIEATGRKTGFRRLDLNDIAAEVVELFDPTAEMASVRLILTRDGLAAPVIGDRDLLFDAISNLVDNAIKHGGNGGEVNIGVVGTTDGPLLTIADRGPGIPLSERQHIFKRFYRLEQSRNSPGNGLGLSLVSAVANLHKIRIQIADNSPGLRIELHFPPIAPEARARWRSSVSTA